MPSLTLVIEDAQLQSREGASSRGKPDTRRRQQMSRYLPAWRVARHQGQSVPSVSLSLSLAQPRRWVRCADAHESAGAPGARPATIPHTRDRRPGRLRSDKQTLPSVAAACTRETAAQKQKGDPLRNFYARHASGLLSRALATPHAGWLQNALSTSSTLHRYRLPFPCSAAYR